VSDNYFENLYIPYAPGDAGGSIGSSLYFLSSKYQSFENLDDPYIGNEFSNEDIKSVLSNPQYKKIKFKYIEDYKKLNDEIVNKLNDKCVIGIFRGRMEFGPRALGNRSIIASPCFQDMKDIINLKIKKRENFRPFAPSIIEDFKDEWFETSFKNYYMSSVEKIKKEKRNLIPAVTHIDGTGRVQCVKSNINIKYYDLIKRFYEKTNVPVILNTSFNENEPIVSTPNEALDCFIRTDMDVLVLENYLITR
jgi:carbamoyltransferase